MGSPREQLRFAVVTAYPEEDWHSRRIASALALYGKVFLIDPLELNAQVSQSQLIVTGQGTAIDFSAVVLVRGLSPSGDAEAQFSIYRALTWGCYLVVNRIDALLDAQDKFRTSHLLGRAGIPSPRAAMVQSLPIATAILSQWKQVVAKPLAGSLGEGVERLVVGRSGIERLAARLEQEKALYLQEWVPNAGYDLRLLVVGGKVAGAVERVAPKGEFRTNMAQGGTARPAKPSAEAERIAREATAALGLDYAGVDLLEGSRGRGLQVIEVNGNPAFDMIYEATGCDVAQQIARHVAHKAARRISAVNRVAVKSDEASAIMPGVLEKMRNVRGKSPIAGPRGGGTWPRRRAREV